MLGRSLASPNKTEPGATAGGAVGGLVGPFAGFSSGGNPPDGPGTNFADVGSTFNGQQLTLVTDTGVFFNGFSCWVGQRRNGQQACQWGGLPCSPGSELSGLSNDGCQVLVLNGEGAPNRAPLP